MHNISKIYIEELERQLKGYKKCIEELEGQKENYEKYIESIDKTNSDLKKINEVLLNLNKKINKKDKFNSMIIINMANFIKQELKVKEDTKEIINIFSTKTKEILYDKEFI